MKENLRGLLKTKESFKSEKEYRESMAMSYSIFKDVYDNPDILITPRKDKKEEWATFGSVVDMLLTSSQKEIDDKIVVNDTVPSEQYKLISDYIIENNFNINNLTDIQIEECYNNTGSKVNWGIPVKKQKILDNCTKYIELIHTSKSKLIISSDLYKEAQLNANTFITHPWSSFLFMSEVEQKAQNIEILYQYKIKYILRDLLFKSMLDVIIVDHKNKKIRPYDLKTGSDYFRVFLKSAIYKYKYMYQAALYKEGLKAFIKEIPEFEDYEVADFRFVYVSRLKPLYPVILRISDEMHYSFMEIGLQYRYSLPSVQEIMRALKSYLNKIELGETNLTPYDLTLSKGEYELEEDISNNELYYQYY